MPDPNVPQISTQMDFSDAPGGDLSFDDLFPPDGAQTTVTPPAAPDPQVQPDYFLKTSTGTVYKTAEEAAQGIAHKDALLEKLRQREISRTGVDPLTEKQVSAPKDPVQPVNYLQDKKRYFSDLKAAVDGNNEEAYLNAQTKLVFDALESTGLAPVITSFAKSQAVEKVSNEIKDFRTFRESPDYNESVGKFQILQQAIEQAENNTALYAQLPELYQIAYYVSRGVKLPEIVKATPTPQATQPSRPSLSQSTLTPPSAMAPQEGLRTSEGRKAIISRMESQGIGDMKW